MIIDIRPHPLRPLSYQREKIGYLTFASPISEAQGLRSRDYCGALKNA